MQVLIFFCLNLFKGTKRSGYQWCWKEYKDTETKARMIGVQTQINKFNYFFGVNLAILLLWYSDNLGATFQSRKLSDTQVQLITRETVITLEKLRDNDKVLLFRREALTESEQSRYWWARLRKKKESVPANRRCL